MRDGVLDHVNGRNESHGARKPVPRAQAANLDALSAGRAEELHRVSEQPVVDFELNRSGLNRDWGL